MGRPNEVEFEDTRCIAETTDAIKCVVDEQEVWIPKSQVTDNSEVWKKGDEGKLVITEWIATEKGLI